MWSDPLPISLCSPGTSLAPRDTPRLLTRLPVVHAGELWPAAAPELQNCPFPSVPSFGPSSHKSLLSSFYKPSAGLWRGTADPDRPVPSPGKARGVHTAVWGRRHTVNKCHPSWAPCFLPTPTRPPRRGHCPGPSWTGGLLRRPGPCSSHTESSGFMGPGGTPENTRSFCPQQGPWEQGPRAGAQTPVPQQVGPILSSEPRQATSQPESSPGPALPEPANKG